MGVARLHRTGWSTWWVLAVLVAGACNRAADRPHETVTVRAHLPTNPVSLSLIGKTGDNNSAIIAALVTDSLVQYDEHMNLVPRLAASWDVSADGKVLTFHMRRGVRWQDGEPVTSADVVYSVEMAREPTLENRSFGPLFRPEQVGVEALDAHTVRATYSAPSPDALDAWRLPIVPRHVVEREARPGDGSAAKFFEGSFASHPIGCGPFRLASYVADQEVVLEAWDGYWAGRPSIDRLVLRVVPELRTAYQALVRGDLELVNVTPELWREGLASEARERLAGFVYHRLSVWQVVWNLDGSNPFFQDPRVRQALVLGLDREQFSRAVQDGLAKPGITAIHPDTPWADASLRPWPYDVAEARRLLDEAGWVDADGDGVRERDGRRFRFRHHYPVSAFQLVDQIAAWLQASWRELGVEVESEKLEWRAFQELRNTFRFEAASFSLNVTPTPSDLVQIYHSSARGEGWNFGGFADPEVDRLLDEVAVTIDARRRLELVHRLQRRIHELEPVTYLFHFPTPVLHDKRLRGITPAPIDYWRTTRGPQTWSWDAGAR